ncbi:hypothetical protein ACFSM9_29930, partial [Microvirga arabica]|uniref:hypothetical protein n=1 Tax=Microvirga arabica TaxID=1128671 RepID=UPI0036323473
LFATRLMERRPLQRLLAQQGRVILALDGVQPDLGYEIPDHSVGADQRPGHKLREIMIGFTRPKL